MEIGLGEKMIIESIIEYGNIIINDWYYIMIVISIILSLIAGIIHNNGTIILFSIILNTSLIYYQDYLRIMINNYMAYENNTILGYMITIISITWIIIYSLIHINIIIYGNVVE